MTNKTEQYREKYQIDRIERMSIGTSYKSGYEVYFKEDIPKDREELERVCAVVTGEIYFETSLSIDEENKRVYYWGITG